MVAAASTSFRITLRFCLLVLFTIGPRPAFSKQTMRIMASGVLGEDGNDTPQAGMIRPREAGYEDTMGVTWDAARAAFSKTKMRSGVLGVDGNDASGQAGMIRRREAGLEEAIGVTVDAAGAVSPSIVKRDGHNTKDPFDVQVLAAGGNVPSGDAGMIRRRGVGNEVTVDVLVDAADLCGQTCQDVFATMSTGHYAPCDAFYFPPCSNQAESFTDSANLHELCPHTCQREYKKDAERQRGHLNRMTIGAFKRQLRVHWGVGLSLIILSALIVVAVHYLSGMRCFCRRSGKECNNEYDNYKQQAEADNEDDTDEESSPVGDEVGNVPLPKASQPGMSD